MRYVWAILCQQSIVDENSKNISLIGSIESVKFAAEGDVAGIPLEAVLVTFWTRSDLNNQERATFRVNIVTPENKIHKGKSIEIDLMEFKRLRFNYRIMGMPFTNNGIYEFVIQLRNEENGKWREVASIPLEITRESPKIQSELL